MSLLNPKTSYQLAVRWKRFISSKENVDDDQILQIGREFDSENARAATRSGWFPRTHVSRPNYEYVASTADSVISFNSMSSTGMSLS